MIPTSNHNWMRVKPFLLTLYIFWFLHQTTTGEWCEPKRFRCISFDSYIKPQLNSIASTITTGCISFDSYIKPQPFRFASKASIVVYLLIPTSNHNLSSSSSGLLKLYIFWFLHQTTTFWSALMVVTGCISFDSYIKPQLALLLVFGSRLYIFWFLHQTTT